MSKETKNIAASIKGRLTNIAKKQNMIFDSIIFEKESQIEWDCTNKIRTKYVRS